MTHLGLLYHCTSNPDFYLSETLRNVGADIIGCSFSSRFLMHELLAVAAQHLSTIHQDKAQFYREQSARLQGEALRLFNNEIKEIGPHNIISAFLFAGLLGMNFLADTFSASHDNFDQFLDQLVQSFKLQHGVRVIVLTHRQALRNSELRPLFEWHTDIERTDEIAAEFKKLRAWLQETTQPPSEAEICDQAIRTLLETYSALPFGESDPVVIGRRVVTVWPASISPEYNDLLARRKPEALLILAYYTPLLHNARHYWAIGTAGKTLLEGISTYLGNQWEQWLFWPRSYIARTI